MRRPQFLLSAGSAAALAACGGGGGTAGVTVVPAVAVRNAYAHTNFVVTKASYGAQFLIPEMIGARGIAICPAGAGGQASPGDLLPFNIWVSDSRVFIAYCNSQPLKNSAGQITDMGQFFAGEEASLDAASEGLSSNRGKLVEYTLTRDLDRIFDRFVRNET